MGDVKKAASESLLNSPYAIRGDSTPRAYCDGFKAGAAWATEEDAGRVPTSWLDKMFVGAPKQLDQQSVEWVCTKILAAIRGGRDR